MGSFSALRNTVIDKYELLHATAQLLSGIRSLQLIDLLFEFRIVSWIFNQTRFEPFALRTEPPVI